MKREESVVVRAQSFDLFASRFTGLYDLGIKLHPLWGPRLRKVLPHLKGPRVLEVSFGTGYLMSLYADRFETTGLDYNPRMISAATRRLQRKGLSAELIQGDAHELPFDDGSFECLVNTDAFSLYSDPPKAMAEFYRVLSPGGRLLLMEWDYPCDRNWLGMKLTVLPRLLKMPYVDFDPLFKKVGFTYTDQPVGLSGMLHLFIADKPVA